MVDADFATFPARSAAGSTLFDGVLEILGGHRKGRNLLRFETVCGQLIAGKADSEWTGRLGAPLLRRTPAMSWSALERGGRTLWTAFLIFALFVTVADMLTAAGMLRTVGDGGAPPWRIQGFPDLRAYFASSGEEFFLLSFALVGLWVRQPRRMLNWAWSMPLLFNIVLHAYIYP